MASIFVGVNFLCVVLFVSETRYNRDFSASLATSTLPTLSPDYFTGTEKKVVIPSPTATELQTPSGSRPDTPLVIPHKTFLQRMSLYSGVSKTNVFKMFVRPFPLFLFPATTFAFLAYAVALFLVVSVNLLNSFVLEAPPYNWSIAKDGLINIPYVAEWCALWSEMLTQG